MLDILNNPHSTGERRVEELNVSDGIVVINPTTSRCPKYIHYDDENGTKVYGLQAEGILLERQPKSSNKLSMITMDHIWHYVETRPGENDQYVPRNHNFRNILVWVESNGMIGYRDLNYTEAQKIYKKLKHKSTIKDQSYQTLSGYPPNVEKTQSGTYKTIIPCIKHSANRKRKSMGHSSIDDGYVGVYCVTKRSKETVECLFPDSFNSYFFLREFLDRDR